LRSLEALYDVCRRHHVRDHHSLGIVLPEPYIPYLPPVAVGEDWNGVLLLAEAQNMGNREVVYCDKLESAHQRDRWNRLNLSYCRFPEKLRPSPCGVHRDVAIAPWKNGVMPFVVVALAELHSKAADVLGTDNGLLAVQHVAVCNAVPWSRRNDKGGILRPITKGLWSPDAEHAVDFWRDLIPRIECTLARVKQIWAFGRVAQEVIWQVAPAAQGMPSASNANYPHLWREAVPFLQENASLGENLHELLDSTSECLGISKGNKRFILYCAAVALKRYRNCGRAVDS